LKLLSRSCRAGRDVYQVLVYYYIHLDRYLRDFFIKGDNPEPELNLKFIKILDKEDKIKDNSFLERRPSIFNYLCPN
jgi:hypothetical protein